MANRIAGITVEIGGDTTKLSTALKSVNSEIKSTQSQLRDVNKLLKLDPGNTELITQKHKLLAQAVSETKLQIGPSLRDLDLLTVGMVNDIFIENQNDDYDYREVVCQDDFDKF